MLCFEKHKGPLTELSPVVRGSPHRKGIPLHPKLLLVTEVMCMASKKLRKAAATGPCFLVRVSVMDVAHTII